MPTPVPVHQEIKKPVLLLGEGNEELAFFNALLKHMEIDSIQVEAYHGKPKLAPVIRTLQTRPGFKELTALGVTRDADTDCNAAFQSICYHLTHNGFSAPPALGLVTQTPVRIGVWVFPDCTNPGMLEDFFLSALQHSPDIQCIEDFLACIQQTTDRRSANSSKARVYAWLSSQVNPSYRLGEAAAAGLWPFDHSAFEPFRNFINSLLS